MTAPVAPPESQGAAQRVGSALGKRSNWEQLAKFCVVGASGYLVNLAVYDHSGGYLGGRTSVSYNEDRTTHNTWNYPPFVPTKA